MKNFLLNTDYPIDKLVLVKELTLTSNNSGVFSHTFNHGLGAVPFVKAVASIDGWNTTYQNGVSELDASGQVTAKTFEVRSNGEQVSIYGYLSNSQNEVKIRLWGVFCEAETQNVSVTPTANQTGQDFLFNSDYNYQSLLKEGKIDISGGNANVSHALGFIPQVDIWTLESGWWKSLDYPAQFFPNGLFGRTASVTSTELRFEQTTIPGYTNFYYRIYSDEA